MRSSRTLWRAAVDGKRTPAYGWFVGIALLTAGPLLGRGYLLLLDFAAGPHFAKLDLLPLPSSGDLGNGVPLIAAEAALAAIYEPLAAKATLLAPIVLGGIGIYRFTRQMLRVDVLPAIAAGTLYVVNPFVHDRYLAGHLYFVLGYALLPWALAPIFRAMQRPTPRGAAVVALWFSLLTAISIHLSGIYALLAAASLLFMRARVRTRALFAAATALLGALLCAYWLPAELAAAPGRRVGVADLAVYQTRSGRLTVLPTLITMYGFWRREFVRPADQHPWLYLLFLPILAAVVGGAVVMLRGRERRLGGALAVAGILALLLAAGTALTPTADAFRWLFGHVFLLKAYREPQKFLALTTLAYAVFVAVALDRVVRRRSLLSYLAVGVAFASILGYGYSMFWGLSGEVSLDHYPSSWAQANLVMARKGGGRLLFLPWRLYDVWAFTDGRIVANPAKSYFTGRDVLAGDNVGFRRIPTQSADPFSYYIQDLLAHRARLRWFGHLVAPLDVRFVAWSAEADLADYEMLARQRDLRSIYFGADLVVFENRAWRGDELPLHTAATASVPAGRGTPVDREASQRLFDRPPPVGRTDTGFPAIARPLPIWERVRHANAPLVSVGERCTDGWRLGDELARCHLGAVAAFATRTKEAVLWRPLAGLRLLGYAVSGLTLVLILALCRRRGS